ncbi:hypothetical protein NEDG_02236, partial [Nematocida displodere]
MDLKTVFYHNKVGNKLLSFQILCLAVLSSMTLIYCSNEYLGPEHIISPYTKQTIKFFERSGSEGWSNQLRTVQIDGKRCILKDQKGQMTIFLQNYPTSSVPRKLVPRIVFTTLIIKSSSASTNQININVLKKILRAFGTIYANTLNLIDLKHDGFSASRGIKRLVRGFSPHNKTPTRICILNINILHMFDANREGIKWFQGRVDMSQCQIGLLISPGVGVENLKFLDEFNAAKIIALYVIGNASLDSLECKLLRKGPLPDVLVLDVTMPTPLEISDRIIQNMVSKHWEKLSVSLSIWELLMKSGEEPKHLTIDDLVLLAPYKNPLLMAELLKTPTAKSHNLATVERLRVGVNNVTQKVTEADLKVTFEFVARYFRGLESIFIQIYRFLANKSNLVRNSKLEITTNPTVRCIIVNGSFCSLNKNHNPN